MLNVTQTEVVMSKTVKRAMRVMMIGLVALLGAKAEAHYYVVRANISIVVFIALWTLKRRTDPIAQTRES